jgi:hypothetical protein
LEDLLLNQKLFDHLGLQLGTRVPRFHLLTCKFGNFEWSLQSRDGHCERVQGHELTLMTNIAAGMRRDHVVMLLNAGLVLFPPALSALDEGLELLLVRALMIGAVVALAEAIDVGFAPDRGVVKQARLPCLLRLLDNLLVRYLVQVGCETQRIGLGRLRPVLCVWGPGGHLGEILFFC